MNKTIVSLVAGAAFMAMPLIALASTNISDITFDGSGPNVTVQAGDTVNSKVTLTLSSGSELESLGFQLVDNSGNSIGVPQTCVDVADRVVAGTYTVEAPIDTTGSTEGTFGIRVRAYGLTGPGADNNCGGSVNDNEYFSNRITFTEDANSGNSVANNTGAGNGNGGSSGNSLANLLAILIAKLTPTTTTAGTPTPVPSTACAQLNATLQGTQMNVYNSANVALQGFLLFQHQSIPALAAGASFGYFGNQTSAALQSFKLQNSCL